MGIPDTFLKNVSIFITYFMTCEQGRVFPKPFTHRGTSAGDKALMRGTHEGAGIDLMEGPNFDKLYHKLKVLLLLSCNYMMQVIGYDSIKTC